MKKFKLTVYASIILLLSIFIVPKNFRIDLLGDFGYIGLISLCVVPILGLFGAILSFREDDLYWAGLNCFLIFNFPIIVPLINICWIF